MNATQEAAHMRSCIAWNLRRNGMTYEQLGSAFGVSTERARQLVLRYERNVAKLVKAQAASDAMVRLHLHAIRKTLALAIDSINRC